MAQEYTIASVKLGKQWQGHGKTFQAYYLGLNGVSEPVSMNKVVPVKASPEIGDVLYGVLEDTEFGKKFTATERPPEAFGSPVGASKPSGGWTESPEKQQAINRAVALNNAVLLISSEEGTSNEETVVAVLKTADKFYEWLSKTDKGNVDGVLGETKPVNLDDIPY